MTATAIMFNGTAFALAADGNQLLDRGRDMPITALGETNSAQKIFPFETRNIVCACILCGDVVSEDRKFDAAVELKRHLAAVAHIGVKTPRELVANFGAALSDHIEHLIAIRQLKLWPALQIPFVGFCGADAFYLTLYINRYRASTGLHYELVGQVVDKWLFSYTGSPVIAELMQKADSRIPHCIRVPSETPISLQEAVEVAQGYITACSSPLGRELDPEWAPGLGGHIHVATVMPVYRPSWWARQFQCAKPTGGFAWVLPPQNLSQL